MEREESPSRPVSPQALDDAADDEANSLLASASGVEAEALKSSSLLPEENGAVTEEVCKQETVGKEEQDAEKDCEVTFAVGAPEQTKQSPAATPDGGNEGPVEVVAKKSKKRTTNVWTKTTSRKSAKRNNSKNGASRPSDAKDDTVVLKPFHQEDDSSYPILLSKINKAEKIELSLDRLTASGQKGYRMVKATRGVVHGAWYFEIHVANLGSTGHTRLGWSTRRGDIQAPVGYDAHSYAYRDVDGSKVHSATRAPYGDLYLEGDTIGFYINLPRDPSYVPKPEVEVVGWKGQPYIIDAEEPLQPLPGSEILYFRNGVCQGVAFKDINDGTYYPAASMYTLPGQDVVRLTFNFGPDFKYPPVDLGDRPMPAPMCSASGPLINIRKLEEPQKAPSETAAEPVETPGSSPPVLPDDNTNGVSSEEQQQKPAKQVAAEPQQDQKKKPVKRAVKTTPPATKKKPKPAPADLKEKPPPANPKTGGIPPKAPGPTTKTKPSSATAKPGAKAVKKAVVPVKKVDLSGSKTPGLIPKAPEGPPPAKKSKAMNGQPITAEQKSEAARSKFSQGKGDPISGPAGRRPLDSRYEI